MQNQQLTPTVALNNLYIACRQLNCTAEVHDNLKMSAEFLLKFIQDSEEAQKVQEVAPKTV